MSDLLALGGNGVLAYQRALVTVSNNIANVATDGYSRQEVGIASLPPRAVGNDYLGTGVATLPVRRQYDEFVDANLRRSASNLAGQAPLVDYANRIVDLMVGGQSSLAPALGRFFDAARELSTSPGATIQRTAFLREAGSLASGFQFLQSQLTAVDEETVAGLEVAVSRANVLAEQIAQVNRQLQRNASVSRQPPELLDQRDRLLRELSDIVEIRVQFLENGEANVRVLSAAGRGVLVDRGAVDRMSVARNPASGRVEIQMGPISQRESLIGLSGGAIGGLLAFREQVLGASQSRLDEIAARFVEEVNAAHRSGIDALGRPGGDLFGIESGTSAAAGIRLLIQDPLAVAAAAAFRAVADARNVSLAVARVDYQPADASWPVPLPSRFASDGLQSAPQTQFVNFDRISIAALPAGLEDPVVQFALSPGQWPQVVTRDGRHLLGAPLTQAQRLSVMSADGMMPGATYDDRYLNTGGGPGAYLDADYFLGVREIPRTVPAYDPETGERVGDVSTPATVRSGHLGLQANGIGAGALRLNGIALGALSPTARASDVAAWINAVEAQTGVTATAVSEVRLPAGDVFARNLVGSRLTLSAAGMGAVELLAPAGGYRSVDALAAAINERTATSGVSAHVSAHGDLILASPDSDALTVGGDLLTVAGTFGGRLTLTALDPETEIRLGFGDGGNPEDLARLGFATAVHWEGKVPEDLLLLVSGSGEVEVSAAYRAPAYDAQQDLRTRAFVVEFLDSNRYTITDAVTGTVLAERDYDPHDPDATIAYRGLELRLSLPPQPGDRFTIDGNFQGLGDNRTALLIAALQTARTMPGGLDFEASYVEQSGRVGNVGRQADIARQALEVVYQQALKTRDEVSGVSLDQEASDLIRFQQAYQASARVMQAATTLFDALLRVA